MSDGDVQGGFFRGKLVQLKASAGEFRQAIAWKRWQSLSLLDRLWRSPAMMLLAGVIFGSMLASHWQWFSLPAAIGLGIGVLILALCLWRVQAKQLWLRQTLTVILAIVLGAGWWSYRVTQESVLFEDESQQPLLMDMQATVLSRPIRRDQVNSAISAMYEQQPKYRFLIHVHQLHHEEQREPVDFKLQVTTLELPADMGPGSEIRMKGWVKPWQETWNPGEFDYRRYMLDRGVEGRVFIDQAGLMEVESAHAGLWGAVQWYRWRVSRWVADRFDQCWQGASDTRAESLLGLLVLGEVPSSDRDLELEFREAGLAHLLAISGLHLGLLALACWGVCRFIGIGPRGAAWMTLATMSVYALLLSDRISVTRAFLMMAALCIATGVGRRWSNSVVLCWVGLGLWLYEPAEVFGAGFQLSFGVVAGIMWLTPGLRASLMQLFRVDPQRHWKHRLAGVLIDYVVVGIVAWSVSMPLMAYHFGQVKWFALFWGLLVTPLIMLVLILGFLQLLSLVIHPALGSPWLWFIQPLGDFIISGAQWPMNHGIYGWSLNQVPWYWVLLTLLGLVLLFAERHRWRRSMGLVILILCMLSVVFPQWYFKYARQNEVHISIIAVGDGNCYLIQHQGENWLYDCGSRSHASVGRSSILPALHSQGVRRLHRVFISHPDADHYNALPDLLQVMPVDEVVVGQRWQEVIGEQKGVAFVTGMLEQKGVPVHVAGSGEVWELGEMKLRCLWPTLEDAHSSTKLSDNDTSLVLQLNFGGRRVLFAGDIENEGIKGLVQNHVNSDLIKSDVMEAPHHGAFVKNSEMLLDAVQPAYVWHSSSKVRKKQKDNWRDLDLDVIHLTCARRGMIRLQIEEFGRIDWWTHREIDSRKDPQ